MLVVYYPCYDQMREDEGDEEGLWPGVLEGWVNKNLLKGVDSNRTSP